MSSNVIDFTARRKAQISQESGEGEWLDGQEVIDITEMRAEEIDRDRRDVRRTILTEFVSTYVVLPDIGLRRISLYDISMTGIAFDLGFEEGRFEPGESVAVRIYLNKNTYFPFVVSVANVREITGDGVYRHGSTIVEGTVNDVALHHFISFIETVSTTLMKDEGDVMVNNLKP